MILGVKSKHKLKAWEWYFCWYPVEMLDGRWAWMEYIYRRRMDHLIQSNYMDEWGTVRNVPEGWGVFDSLFGWWEYKEIPVNEYMSEVWPRLRK